MIEADYLLFSETSDQSNLSTQGILTTKLFEYLGSGRPILADISTQTLAGGLIQRCCVRGIVTDSKMVFLKVLGDDGFYSRRDSVVTDETLSFTRENLAAKYLELIQEVKRDI